jgi:nitroreductase
MATRWESFCAVNEGRRAIREFDGTAVADEDVRAVLEQALLAPSSGNLQPYQVHWIRDAATRVQVASACRGQRAAASAPVLLVVTAGVPTAQATAAAHLAHLDACATLDDRARQYHRAQVTTFIRFMRWGTSCLWSPLHAAICTMWPGLSVIPIGAAAARHWAARSAVYAAQTILLAASARGLDSCPMEGFDGRRLARVLGLSRSTVIPVVIAIGRRRSGARVDPRWRRPFSSVVVVR